MSFDPNALPEPERGGGAQDPASVNSSMWRPPFPARSRWALASRTSSRPIISATRPSTAFWTARPQYTSNWGLLEPARRRLPAYVDNRFHISYDPKNEILVTVGASEGIDLALRAAAQPRRRGAGARTQLCQLRPLRDLRGRRAQWPCPPAKPNDFVLTPEALEKADHPQAPRPLILPYPNNPTGAHFGPLGAGAACGKSFCGK